MRSDPQPPPPFAVQRLICFALLLGMSGYGIVVAVMLGQHDDRGLAAEPITALDTAVPVVGVLSACGALLCRRSLSAAAGRLSGAARGNALFRATLFPMAMLEGGCLLGLTAWLLNGNALPNLVTALVLFAFALRLVPRRDPDAPA